MAHLPKPALWFASVLIVANCALAAARPQMAPPSAYAVVLPVRLVAGKSATLAVLDAAGSLTAGVAVEIPGSGEVVTDAAGRATFIAPAQAGVVSVQIRGQGSPFAASVIDEGRSEQPRAPGYATAAQPLAFPRVIARTDSFDLEGSGFSGDASRDLVLLGDQQALVLAASPVSLVVLPNPRTPAGPTALSVHSEGRTFSAAAISVVTFAFLAPAKALAAGQQGALTVLVTGTAQRLLIEVRNLSPGVITLSQGNVERLTTSGGAANFATVKVMAVRSGDYALSAHVMPGMAELTDLERARNDLTAARQMATGKWRQRIDAMLQSIAANPQDTANYRGEMALWMADRPPAKLGKLFEDAQEALTPR